MIQGLGRYIDMNFLNPHIAKLAKSKKASLVRKPISCGIFQELEPPKTNHIPQREKANL